MNILIRNVWKNGYLDQTLLDKTVRIKPLAWFNVCKLEGLYFIPEKSWRLIVNYLREIGSKSVFQKIVSRMSESARNKKYMSLGIGIVLDTKSILFQKNDLVIFSALCYPQCMERVVILEDLVCLCRDQWLNETLSHNEILFGDISLSQAIPDCLFQYRGWSEYSGIILSDNFKQQCQSVLNIIKYALKNGNIRKLHHSSPGLPNERHHSSVTLSGNKLKAELFGYGQYAKTIILPSVKKLVTIACIHEIDPTQLPIKKNKRITYDSSPMMRNDDHHDLCFIAGYHHTHAQLAIDALKSGKAAIVEKPIVTTWNDLKALLQAMKSSTASLFSCFHKRYLAFNKYIHKDLGIAYHDPISFHCIVFEVPLPRLHWYKWPNSGSRLLSNGCHWIDYFLFLNAFSSAIRYSVRAANNGDLNIFIELENNAVFTMTLTEVGSSRIGIREHIELRAAKNTVIITDGKQYIAENGFKILRRIKIKRLCVYQAMYRNIVQRILQKEPGDSIDSVERSSSLILSLESTSRSVVS
ncbi:MAG TPA: Gfo/Idh/MocA family oxidoreductase [Gammaproteobacteria bacterium]|nr:Gfo/Idh/MocA family oxidoreductase [Gammaproteobacteria bacterium]